MDVLNWIKNSRPVAVWTAASAALAAFLLLVGNIEKLQALLVRSSDSRFVRFELNTPLAKLEQELGPADLLTSVDSLQIGVYRGANLDFYYASVGLIIDFVGYWPSPWQVALFELSYRAVGGRWHGREEA